MCPLHLSVEQIDEVSAEFLALFPLPLAPDPKIPLQLKRIAYLAKKGEKTKEKMRYFILFFFAFCFVIC
jgi:hypothetical protein